MKKISIVFTVLFCAAVVMSVTGCGYTKIPAGSEGVKVNTLGDDKGSITTVGVGRHFYSPKYEMYEFPLYKQNYIWTDNEEEGSPVKEGMRFQSKNALEFTANIGISYSVMPTRSGDLYKTYHKGIKEITQVDMRNSVRDALNRLACVRADEDIYGPGKSAFIAAVHEDLISYWLPQGINIHKVYLTGPLDPPAQVKKAIAKKIEASQKALTRQNEVAESKAKANKQIAEARGESESRKLQTDAAVYAITQEATAEAEAIRLVQEQLHEGGPEYTAYLQVTRWNGVLPQYMGGGMPLPMINLQ